MDRSDLEVQVADQAPPLPLVGVLVAVSGVVVEGMQPLANCAGGHALGFQDRIDPRGLLSDDLEPGLVNCLGLRLVVVADMIEAA